MGEAERQAEPDTVGLLLGESTAVILLVAVPPLGDMVRVTEREREALLLAVAGAMLSVAPKPRLAVGVTQEVALELREALELGQEEAVVLGVPPVPQALLLTLQLRVAAGEEEMLGEGVALAEWLREAAPLTDLGGVAETLALVRTVAVGSGVREGEGVTV